jgi:hypothetical protein
MLCARGALSNNDYGVSRYNHLVGVDNQDHFVIKVNLQTVD